LAKQKHIPRKKRAE